MGYFGVKSSFHVRKVLRIEEQVLFYSLIGIIINILFMGLNFSVFSLLKSLFPIVFEQYWFMTAYVIVYLLSPFINQLLLLLDRRNYIILLITETIIWGIIPFFTLQENSGMGFTQLIWFIVMYSWGAYFRLYRRTVQLSRYIICIILSILLILGVVVGLNYIGENIEIIYTHTTYFRWSNSPIIIIFSLCIFRLFESLNMKNNRLVNFIASGTLGIYLFHENIFLQPIIWEKIICGPKWFGSIFIALNYIFALIFVFLIGQCIDYIYRKISRKLEPMRDSISKKIAKMFNDFIDNLLTNNN